MIRSSTVSESADRNSSFVFKAGEHPVEAFVAEGFVEVFSVGGELVKVRGGKEAIRGHENEGGTTRSKGGKHYTSVKRGTHLEIVGIIYPFAAWNP